MHTRPKLVAVLSSGLLAFVLLAPPAESPTLALTVHDPRTDVTRIETTTTHPPSTTTTAEPTTTTTAAPPPTTTTEPPVVVSSSPATEQVDRPSGGDCYGWGELVATYWPADQVPTACRVLGCESGGNPTARNPSSSASGLWQFLYDTWHSWRGSSTADQAWQASPDEQTAAAFNLWAASGWSPWSCA